MSEFLWVEKYRPKIIDECILPNDLKSTFQEFVENQELPNLLLSGSAGVGKTTVAKALCNEMGLDHMLINGSEDGNIDTLRTKIRHYASTVSFSSDGKVVILDEADYLNPQSTQPALRGFIEEFSGNCRFILTCNFKNRIIEPLHSRCSTIEFKIRSSQDLRVSNFLFDRIGTTTTTYTDAGGANPTVKIIDSIVRVTGLTTGYAVDIPVRFAKL